MLGVDTIISGIFNIFNKIVPDKDTRLKLQHELELYKLTSDFKNAMSQIEVNKVEAAHESIFVAGWRPFIGWVCGIAFTYHVIVVPLLMFVGNVTGNPIPAPAFDAILLTNVLFGMLGLGGFRTYEKIAANKLKEKK